MYITYATRYYSANITPAAKYVCYLNYYVEIVNECLTNLYMLSNSGLLIFRYLEPK